MYFAVFDGHVGWQVSSACQKKLHTFIEELLTSDKMTEKEIKLAIAQAFDKMEHELLNVARVGF